MDFKHLLFSIVCLLFLGIIYKKIHNYIETDERKDNLNLINKYLITQNKNIEKLTNNNRPKIWIMLNNTINSQKWETYGSRNTTNMNKEYINLCLSSIINKCGRDFDIMLLDIDSFSILLNDWNIDLNKLSDQLRKHFILLGLIKVLRQYGGIILEPNVIMFKSLMPIYKKIIQTHKPVVGEFKNKSLDYSTKQLMPTTMFMGSNKNNALMKDLENKIISLVSQDYTNELNLKNLINEWLYDKIKFNKFDYINGKYIGTKDINDRIINLEELMSDKYLELDSKAFFLYIPDEDLCKRNNYNWFIYLNKKEIIESRTNIGKYLMISYN